MKGVTYMHLKISDILIFPSLKEGKLITGEVGLNHSVTNAIIMEALDIEEWGEYGQILLTSYFAFESADSAKIDDFFKKAKEIGIAGFIFKTDRLVKEIPADFISKCEEYRFPLIQIPKNINYPEIIKDILSSIISRNTLLLKSYYENHQQFLELMMHQADFKQILETLRSLISLPVTLTEKVEKNRVSTDDNYHSFKIIRETSSNNETTLYYKIFLVNYGNSIKETTILAFPIPNLGYEEYELIIHKADNTLSDLQFMAIENAVVALQTEFVQRYALRQNNHSRLNEMASELIFGRLNNKEEIEDTIYNLKLDLSLPYRIVIISFGNSIKEQSLSDFNRFTDKVANLSRTYFNDSIYVKQPRKIILIVPMHPNDLNTMKNKLKKILTNISNYPNYKQKISLITISGERSVYDLPKGYKQAMDIRPLGELWQYESSIIAYDDIGIFKLFIDTENIEALKQFVPEKIWDLQRKNPDLLNTLYTFINVNQNYSETAKVLYVHPKTVRYRVNQLTEQYGIQFDNPNQILHYNIAIRIVRFIEHKKIK